MLLAAFFCALSFPSSAQAQESFPRRANYFLKWTLAEHEARELARWDVVVLDMEIQARHPELLRKMREWNPDIILLAYITPQEIRTDAAQSYSLMRRKLASGIAPDWYLARPDGNRISWWPGTYLLNVTPQAPVINGKRFHNYLADFVINDIWSSGLWDGIFYDNAWDNITYFAKTDQIDLNRDGGVDGNLDAAWRDGMKALYRETRQRAGRPILLVGNGLTQVYANELSGSMFENFANFSWSEIMGSYKKSARTDGPRLNIINANTNNTGVQESYHQMRYGISSSLLEDGYYSFDFGDTRHEQLWWYDEYGVDLGTPLGPSFSSKNAAAYIPDLWRRDFTRGISLVNSTDNQQLISLGGDFEKIHGTQDRRVNDGRIVSEVSVAPKDGLLLLKTFEQLKDVVFTNGHFVRFVRKDGSRVRNGFFVFDPAYKGGDTIMYRDLNGDGQRDTIVVSQNEVKVFRHDGQLYASFFPYTVNYKGELRIAVGDMLGDGMVEILVAPSEGYAHPLMIFDIYGEIKRNGWYPFGPKYKQGYSVAAGALDAGRKQRIVVGKGKGVVAEVVIYTSDAKKESFFQPFGKKSMDGTRIALGDVNRDGKAEIIVAPTNGRGPKVRVFNTAGKLQGKEFSVFTTMNGTTIDSLQTSDVDFDGVPDILAFTKNIGL